MPIYQFQHKINKDKIKIVSCSMSEIKHIQHKLNEQGYIRLYNIQLLGFDRFGSSK